MQDEPTPTTVNRRALELRVGRAIAKRGCLLTRVRPHSSIPVKVPGQYAVIDVEGEQILAYVDLEPYARSIGCIREGELVKVGTRATMSKGFEFE